MATTDLIVPLVVAGLGLLGSLVSLILSWVAQQRAHANDIDLEALKNNITHNQTVSDLTEKYAQPLLVAAYDLQQRLYELVEYPISRQHLEKEEGLEDLKIFTCYLLAQYLAYTYILRTRTSYLSFSFSEKGKAKKGKAKKVNAEEDKAEEDKKRLNRMRNMMYMIDEELDRRRDIGGRNVGVWPAARILVCERMMVDGNDLNAALDGGFGVGVMKYDDFYQKWEEKFQQPMRHFCEWIDLMLDGRMSRNPYKDAPLRCLQHLLVDLVKFLDQHKSYIPQHLNTEDLKCKKSGVDCDCERKGCQDGGDMDNALKVRQKSRLGDAGLWAHNGLHPFRKEEEYDPSSDNQISLEKVKKMTYKIDLL